MVKRKRHADILRPFNRFESCAVEFGRIDAVPGPSGHREKISVFVCGVQKGGTTSLHAHLREHADLQAPDRKELHFFDDEATNWADPGYDRLEHHFGEAANGRLRFDITPIYSFWPNSLDRIAAYNPAARLIFLFRDPFERAVSHWAMEFSRGADHLDFSRAIREGRERLVGLDRAADAWRVYSYLERGLYAGQVERALSLFPREQLLFLRSEDLRDRHPETLDRISRFLRISPFVPTAPKREHGRYATPGAVGPVAGDLPYIADFVAADMRRFAQLSQLDIGDWPVVQAILARRRAA